MALSIRERIATVSLDGMTEEQLKVMRSLAYFAEAYADIKAEDAYHLGNKEAETSFHKLSAVSYDLWDRSVSRLKALSWEQGDES